MNFSYPLGVGSEVYFETKLLDKRSLVNKSNQTGGDIWMWLNLFLHASGVWLRHSLHACSWISHIWTKLARTGCGRTLKRSIATGMCWDILCMLVARDCHFVHACSWNVRMCITIHAKICYFARTLKRSIWFYSTMGRRLVHRPNCRRRRNCHLCTLHIAMCVQTTTQITVGVKAPPAWLEHGLVEKSTLLFLSFPKDN